MHMLSYSRKMQLTNTEWGTFCKANIPRSPKNSMGGDTVID